MDEYAKRHPSEETASRLPGRLVCRQLTRSKGLPSNALVRTEIEGDRERAPQYSRKLQPTRLREGCEILIKRGLESCPTRRARAGHEAPLLWFQVDGVLRDLIESSHCLGIGFKSALRHDQIGELGGDVHVG